MLQLWPQPLVLYARLTAGSQDGTERRHFTSRKEHVEKRKGCTEKQLTPSHTPPRKPPTHPQNLALCWPVSPSEEASSTTKTQQHCPQMCREQTPRGTTRVSCKLLLGWWELSIKSNCESCFLGQSSRCLGCLAQRGYNVQLGVPAKTRDRGTRCCSVLQPFWGKAIAVKVVVDLMAWQACFRFSKKSFR